MRDSRKLFSPRPRPALLITAVAGLATGAAGLGLAPARSATVSRVEFNRDIRPILSDKCFSCHGPDANHRQAGLRLDTEEGAKAGRSGRRALVPGKPDQSTLIQRAVHPKEALRMPPAHTQKALTSSEITLLKRWIEQGGSYQKHWSYIPPRVPQVPTVKQAGWVRNPIDRFVLAKIEGAGLKPAPEADRVTLIRRLSFDLTGMPPTPSEVDTFLADGRPDAYERQVDRLLASPRYGERMAMYWLDLVRYADTVGYHGDQEHPISPYRDYVIQAFNDDMPFDRFTVEQLAGDLLPNPTVNQKIASGYNRLLQTTHEGGAQDKEYLAKYAADRVRNVSSVWMGATMGCAECHDHKYDPYSQKDFYSLVSFFADIQERGAYPGADITPTVRAPELEVLSPFDQVELERIRKRIEELKGPVAVVPAGSSAQGQLADARQEIVKLEKRAAELAARKRRTMITVSVPPRTIRVLKRGDWMDETGEIVQPAVPHFLTPIAVKGRRATRLDLARWLTSPDHPQTSRVFVNRIWYLLFGAGLCRSLDDTGNQGEWPTHPELLDYIASRFAAPSAVATTQGSRGQGAREIRTLRTVEGFDYRGLSYALRNTQYGSVPSPRPPAPGPTQGLGWSTKSLVRLIVTSAAYRQSSVGEPALVARDPENRLFARQGRSRVPAEMIRDSALGISGLLVERLGGPSARPYQPDGYYALLNFPRRTYKHDTDDNQYRRGVYVHWQRQFLHPMLRAFDAPSREECTAQRPITNTPLSALTLLNDPTFVEAARVFATRIMKEGGPTEQERARWAWRMVLSRQPLDRETETLLRLYRENLQDYRADAAAAEALLKTGMAPQPPGVDRAELAAWTSVGRALLNLSEAITRN